MPKGYQEDNMETEYKFRLTDESQIDEIINAPVLDAYVNRDAVDTIEMHAVYFDTEDEDLRKAGIAYRIRQENDRTTATIKWSGKVENGLHSREEFNLVINDERFAEKPNIDIFESSEAYDVLYGAAGNKKLFKTVEMNFVRKLIKIDTGASISALSFDVGSVTGKERSTEIMEMEVEWYHGDEDDFKAIALKLAEKYDLKTEGASKLRRGFKDEYDGICR